MAGELIEEDVARAPDVQVIADTAEPAEAEWTPESVVAETIAAIWGRRAGEGRFVMPAPPWTGPTVHGGLVAAQAMAAATQSVDDDRIANSFRCTFHRPMVAGTDVDITVDAARDGRAFSTRQVTMTQAGKQLVAASASFHVGSPSPTEHAVTMPDGVPGPPPVSAPEEFHGPIDLIELEPTTRADGRRPGLAWMRYVAPVPDDAALHACLITHMSDFTRVASNARPPEQLMHGIASLDHAVWFHRPARPDEWLLYEIGVVTRSARRAFIRGQLWSADGTLVASTAQEALELYA